MNPKTKSIVTAVIVVLVLAIGAFIYLTLPATAPGPENMPSGENTPAATSTPATTTNSNPTPGGITMAEVATHSSASSCWTVIRGNVYNLTTWIGQHPGGQAAILQLCGKDGTSAFVNQHGGSAQQEKMLATFKLGVVAQ